MIEIRIKKQMSDGVELVDPLDIFQYFQEDAEQGKHFYALLSKIADYLNYYSVNTSLSFIDQNYARLEGYVYGWCSGAGYVLEESDFDFIVVIRDHFRLIVEKPTLPSFVARSKPGIKLMVNKVTQ